MSTPIHIRLVNEQDFAPITALLNYEIDHGIAHFGTSHESEASIRSSWDASSTTHPWLIAFDDQGGFLGFAKSAPWSSRGAYAWCVEVSVYLAVEARGKGLGRTLYERLFSILRDQGYITVIAGASIPNDASDALHKAIGMRVIGEHASIGYKNGNWYGVRYYQGFLIPEQSTPGAILRVGEVI